MHCGMPGTDHASIATEVKIIEKLKEEGIDKERHWKRRFLERAWEWKKEYGGRIIIAAEESWVLPVTGTESALPWMRAAHKAVTEVFCQDCMKKAIFTRVPVSSTGVRYAIHPFPTLR